MMSPRPPAASGNYRVLVVASKAGGDHVSMLTLEHSSRAEAAAAISAIKSYGDGSTSFRVVAIQLFE